MKTNNRIKSDSVNLSYFLQRAQKKVAKLTTQFMHALDDLIIISVEV